MTKIYYGMKKIGLLIMFLVVLFLPSFASADTIISRSEGYLSENTIWTTLGSPYFIEGDIDVPSNISLTIEPGVIVYMQGSAKFNVYGSLKISGTTITAKYEEYVKNGAISFRWGGFVFYPDSYGEISDSNIKYAGYVNYYPGGPAVSNSGGELSLKNSELSNNFQAINHKLGTTTIENTLIDQNTVGVSFEGDSFSLINSTISNSTSQAFGAYNGGKIYLRNNIFSNNKYNGYIDLKVNYDTASTTFIGGDYDSWIISGSPIGEKTISNIDDKPIITYGFIIEPGNTLNIAPGTTIKGQNSSYIINRGGILNINGTKDNPVIFTSTDGNLYKTAGVQTETGGITNISYANIKYAGGGQYAGPILNTVYSTLLNSGGELIANNINISDTYHTGIFHGFGTTTITDINITGGMDAAIRYYSGNLKIENSSLNPSYANYIFENLSNLGIPDLRNNWWGYPEGPYHPIQNPTGYPSYIMKGDVLFKPFLTENPLVSKTINPVIIIPGIMGSAKKNGKWIIDPILHTYDDLIATLKANGYEENKNLFTFPYEWRDSNIITANLLKQKISATKTECQNANLPDISCDKVDLVAHSMGGLVAREYIQSAQYQNDVDQVIFLGTPHNGSPKAYLQWEAGEFPKDRLSFLLKLVFTFESYKNGYTNLFNYIQNKPILSVKELLPISDYIKEKDTGNLRTYPNNYPRNTFLEYLNNDVSKLLNSGVHITNIIGDVGNNSTINIIRVAGSSDTLWANGKPDEFDNPTSDRGLERGIGDETVTISGATLNSSINNEVWNNVDHLGLPRETSARIFNILTNKTANNVIFLTPIEKIFSIQLQSPIDILVVAPDGKKIGKNFETSGEYTEIENAFYSGFDTDEEYITIPNPLDGEYKIELQGTGEGGEYGVKSVLIDNNNLIENEYKNSIDSGEMKNLTLSLDSVQKNIDVAPIIESTPEKTETPKPISSGGSSGSSRRVNGEVLGVYTDEISEIQKEKMIKLISLLQELIKLYNLYITLYH